MSSRSESMQSVERTTNILLALAADGPIGVSALAQRLGFAKSVVHRVLDSLSDSGFVEQDATSKLYRLGYRVVELGLAALEAPDINSHAYPILVELARKTHETSTLS